MSNAERSIENIIRGGIASSPFARLVGLQVESIAADSAVLRLPFRPEIATVGDVVHGGAIACLIDTAATAAAWSGVDLEKPARGTTVGLTVNFLGAARGQDTVATAKVIQRGRTICVCDVEVHSADGASVARALVTYKVG